MVRATLKMRTWARAESPQALRGLAQQLDSFGQRRGA